MLEPTPTLRFPPVGICAAVRAGLGFFCLGRLGFGDLGVLGAAGFGALGVGFDFGFDFGGMMCDYKRVKDKINR